MSGSFQAQIIRVHKYITEYGLNEFRKRHPRKSEDLIDNKEFIGLVHSGFQLAQEQIIDLLLKNRSRQVECENEIKKKRLEGKKSEDSTALDELRYQERVIRKLADSIAWQLIGHQNYIVRRLYLDQEPCCISSSNINFGLSFSKDYHSENPLRFALLSDLTSFVQLGDAILIDRSQAVPKLSFAELKEGRVNHEILEMMDFYSKSKCDRALYYFFKEKGDKHKEQFFRTVKQQVKMSARTQIINNDGGKDFDGTKVSISEADFEVENFLDEIRGLLEASRKKKWAISVIEDCLFVGVYREGFPSRPAFEMWLKGLAVDYPVYDFRFSFSVPCAYPPFLQPIKREDIVDIATGKIRILFCLYYDNWFKLLGKLGITAQFLSEKDTMNMAKQGRKQGKLFAIENKAISMSKDGQVSHMGDGLLVRMVCNWETPMTCGRIAASNLDASKNRVQGK
ncbi:MAG: hypothetical protein HGA87_02075 [Desulfobulbaceae bacterium]|nr:hypothetical protein [Desulfobulbaceae bacterium]